MCFDPCSWFPVLVNFLADFLRTAAWPDGPWEGASSTLAGPVHRG